MRVSRQSVQPDSAHDWPPLYPFLSDPPSAPSWSPSSNYRLPFAPSQSPSSNDSFQSFAESSSNIPNPPVLLVCPSYQLQTAGDPTQSSSMGHQSVTWHFCVLALSLLSLFHQVCICVPLFMESPLIYCLCFEKVRSLVNSLHEPDAPAFLKGCMQGFHL